MNDESDATSLHQTLAPVIPGGALPAGPKRPLGYFRPATAMPAISNPAIASFTLP